MMLASSVFSGDGHLDRPLGTYSRRYTPSRKFLLSGVG